MKSATQTAQELINDNPHLFKDNSETLLVIGTALINYGEQLTKYTLSKSKETEMQKQLQSLSKIKP